MITSKTLFVQTEDQVELANGTIQLTAIHQVIAFENSEGDVEVEVEPIEFTNITYMGMPIEDNHKGYRKFCEHFEEMGINIEAMIDEACVGIVSNETVESVKNQLLSIL